MKHQRPYVCVCVGSGRVYVLVKWFIGNFLHAKKRGLIANKHSKSFEFSLVSGNAYKIYGQIVFKHIELYDCNCK